jgi:hypothetical protein
MLKTVCRQEICALSGGNRIAFLAGPRLRNSWQTCTSAVEALHWRTFLNIFSRLSGLGQETQRTDMSVNLPLYIEMGPACHGHLEWSFMLEMWTGRGILPQYFVSGQLWVGTDGESLDLASWLWWMLTGPQFCSQRWGQGLSWRAPVKPKGGGAKWYEFLNRLVAAISQFRITGILDFVHRPEF